MAVSVPRALALCDVTPVLGAVWVLLALSCEESLPTTLRPDFFPALHPDGHCHCPSFPPACTRMPHVCVLQVSPSPRLGSSAPTWLLHVNAYRHFILNVSKLGVQSPLETFSFPKLLPRLPHMNPQIPSLPTLSPSTNHSCTASLVPLLGPSSDVPSCPAL